MPLSEELVLQSTRGRAAVGACCTLVSIWLDAGSRPNRHTCQMVAQHLNMDPVGSLALLQVSLKPQSDILIDLRVRPRSRPLGLRPLSNDRLQACYRLQPIASGRPAPIPGE